MPNVCKSCGGDGPQVIPNYCTECIAKHTRREMTLGGCAGCDILALRQAALEDEQDGAPTSGA